jgi:DNA-binding Lrp family transcriptional regulator
MSDFPDLDRIDRQIIRFLQKDARQSNRQLAAAVGLAPSSCLERVRRLRARGVIEGFAAQVDPAALGLSLQAMVSVRLAGHSREVFESVRDRVVDLPEVMAVYHVGGQADFLVHVAVRDAEHLRQLAWDHFTSRQEVGQIETSLIFEYRACRVG